MAFQSVIHSDPEIMSGTPVFVGTRVPIKNLIDYLSSGDPLDEFLDDFPSVTREMAVAVAPGSRAILGAACACCLMNAFRKACGAASLGIRSALSRKWAGRGRRTAR